MLTLEQAKEILRVDGTANDTIIQSLVASLPAYIETTTGMTPEQQYNETLCYTVGGFLLTLWYYSDQADDIKLQRTIDNLLKAISVRARKSGTT